MTQYYDESAEDALTTLEPDDMAIAAAGFLAEVLGLDDEDVSLANDLSAIKRDANAAIFTIQLESSVGPAAFLVYGYVLDERGGDGHTGRELYESGLATLQQAAERDSPGPRAVAHGEADTRGFIIATTPGTFRALAGASTEPAPAPALEPDPATFRSEAQTNRVRAASADELLHQLKAANEQAAQWLGAIQQASQDGGDDDDILAFNESETELALFLLDDRSIGDLLRALNLLVSTAQQHTAAAIED